MKDLNQEQRHAVEADNGPVLIVAGPGTGKTKTLTARIVHLIDRGIPADRILALTFTNKAAREMRKRLSTVKPLPQVTTFHALCHRLLTELRGKPPVLITQTERQQLIRDLKKSHSLKHMSAYELELHISRLKNQPEADQNPLLIAYQEKLAELGVCDFDDLLLDFYHLLHQDKEHPLKDRYQAILVDEFQDTNELQYELLKLLNGTDNLFVIGDPLQSIYGFRGAHAQIFERFKQDWPKATTITLKTNYRSTPQLVNVSNQIFPAGTRLAAYRQETGDLRCVQVLNEYSEANWIINTIEEHIGGSTMLRGSEHHASEQDAQSFRDFAVLYRTHRSAMVVRKLLDESGLPYQVAGEGSPYSQPAIIAILGELRKIDDSDKPVSELIAQKAENLGFDVNSSDLRMLINLAVRFDTRLHAYLEHLDATADQGFYDPSADTITLLTIHAAKGLEFKNVFLIGAEEGLLPYHRPKQKPNIDEERRLFYVAVTRARDSLHLLHTKKRSGESSTLSRFVRNLPTNTLPCLTDPEMATQRARLRKRTIRRSQTTLF